MSMSTGFKRALPLLIMACAVPAAVFFLPTLLTTDSDRESTDQDGSSRTVLNDLDPADDQPASERDPLAASPPSESANHRRAAVLPKGASIAGQVVDLQTREPIPVFDVEARRRDRSGAWKTQFHETVRDGSGLFRIHLREAGSIRITVRSGRHCPETMPDLTLNEGEPVDGLVIALDPGFTLTGRVRDAATRLPVEDALVLPFRYGGDQDLAMLTAGHEAYVPNARTDDMGRFVLEGLDWDDFQYPWAELLRIAAVHPAYAPGQAGFGRERLHDIEIDLASGFALHGIVLDDRGKPAQDVAIQAMHRDDFVFRTAWTDSDGRYRTQPLRPGTVRMLAGVPPVVREPTPNFTPEERVVELPAHDMEVNFGPDPAQVTWLGVLYDPAGRPLSKGEIQVHALNRSGREAGASRLIRTAVTNANGRFELGKLSRDTYRVDVYLNRPKTHIRWDDTTFDAPGPVERDIRLTGATVSGVVLDGRTGKPMQGRSGSVDAHQRTGRFLSFTTRIDRRGRFRFIGLPHGEYDLRARVRDIPSQGGIVLTVENDRPVSGLEIVLPVGGRARFTLEGFEGSVDAFFSLTLEQSGKERIVRGSQRINPEGAWKEEQVLDSGSWKMTVRFNSLGYLEKPFEILHGETVDVYIHRNDLIPYPLPRTVTGWLKTTDDRPVADTRLQISADQAAGFWEDQPYLNSLTDEAGRFEVAGMRPGKWQVRALLDDGRVSLLPELVIPADGRTSRVLVLRLPAGRVGGRLHDAETGAPFPDHGPRWWIALQDSESAATVCRIEGGRTGSGFQLAGVPGGRYRLHVTAPGYFDLLTPAFDVSAEEVLDLGRVSMAPCGVIDLTVVDLAGAPVTSHRLVIDGAVCSEATRRYLGPGRYRYYQIPLGPVWITVEADGYSSETVPVTLDATGPLPFRVVLQAH